MFGGSNEKEILNDAVKYDILAKIFYRVRFDDEDQIPLAREFHAAVIVNDSIGEADGKPSMIVVGGGERNGKLNDI